MAFVASNPEFAGRVREGKRETPIAAMQQTLMVLHGVADERV